MATRSGRGHSRPHATRVAMALGAVLVFAGVALAVWALWGSPGAPNPPAPLASSTAAVREPVVLVAGDSIPFNLAAGVVASGADRASGFRVAMGSRMGCGVGRADSLVGGERQVQPELCRQWPEEWVERVAVTRPDVTVLLAWAWEVHDRVVEGSDGSETVLAVGSEAWRAWFAGEVDAVLDVFTADGAPVLVATMPCVDAAIDAPRRPDPEAAEPHRVAAINEVLAAVVARRADEGVFLGDLHGFLCPDGRYRAVIDGVRITEDGVHWTGLGATVLWEQFFVPELRRVVGG